MTFPQYDFPVLPRLTQINLKSGRVYRIDDGPHKGKVFPSITTALSAKPKPGIEAWKRRQGPEKAARIKDAAANRGTQLHKLFECYLGNEPMPHITNYSVYDLWRPVRAFLDRTVKGVYRQETSVYSYRLAISGRFDGLIDFAEHDQSSDLTIIDLKQANKPKKLEWMEDYFCQGTFYALSIFELTGRKVKRIVYPVASPGELQVFQIHPLEHYHTLKARIHEYYEHYFDADKLLDFSAANMVSSEL